MNKIFNIGVNENLSSSLRDKIRLTNQIAIIISFMTISFLFSTMDSGVLNLISSVGTLSCLGILLLNYLGNYLASRILLCLSPPIILSLTQAIIVQPSEPLIIGATISLITTAIPPFLVFDIRAKSLIIPIVFFIWMVFLFQDNINQWIQSPMDSTFFYSPYMNISSNIVNLLLITYYLFFFQSQRLETEKEKEDEIKLLLESSENMITLHDEDGKYLYYNGPKSYDIKSKDIVGKKPHDFFDKNAADRILTNIKKAYNTGKSKLFESQLDWQGSKKWFSEYIYPVFDREDNIKYVAKICIDINDQKIAEQKLTDSRQRLSLIYNNTQEMMALIRVDHLDQFVIESFNNAAFNWLKRLQPNLEFENPLNLNVEQFYKRMYAYSDEFIAERLEMFKNITSQKEAVIYGGYVELKSSEGIQHAYQESTVTPIFDEQGKCTYLLSVTRDITERLKAEEALKQSEKRLSLIFNSTDSEIGLLTVKDENSFIVESLNRPALERMLHYGIIKPKQEIIGLDAKYIYKNIFNYSEKKTKEKINNFRNVVASKKPFQYQYTSKIKGKKEYFNTKLSPIVNEHNMCSQILFVTENITKRVEATLALQESKNRLSLIFNNTQNYILLTRHDKKEGLIVESFNEPGWNSLRARGLTLKAEDIYNKSIDVFFKKAFNYSDELIQKRVNTFLKVVETKASITYEGSVNIQSDNQSMLYFENTVSPVINEEGEVNYLLFTTRNVSEKKENQLLLEKSQLEIQQQLEQKKLILESTLNGYILVNKDTNIIDANLAYCQLSGYSKEELLQMSINDLEGSRNPKGVEQRAKQMMIKGSDRFETVHYTKDGKELILDTNLSLIRQDDQVMIAGFMRDITAQKKNQLLLEKSKLEFQQQFEQKKLILESTLNGYLLTDKDANILDVNQAYCSIIGYSRDELLQMNIKDIEGQLSPAEIDTVSTIFYQKNGKRFETQHIRKDGSIVDIDANLNLLTIDQEQFVAAFFLDITAQKKTQKELEHRLQFETLLTRLSNQFINVSIEDIDEEVVQSLRQLCEFTKFHRSFVVLFTEDKKYSNTEYEWCKKGVVSVYQDYQKVPLNTFPYLDRKLKNNEHILVKDISDLPEEATGLRSTMQQLNLKSLIHVPLTWRGRTIGFIGFDSLSKIQVWPKDLIILLRFAGEMITNVLQRKKTEETLRSSEQQLSTIYNHSLDNISLIRVENGERFIIQSTNRPAATFVVNNSIKHQKDILEKEVSDVFTNYFNMEKEEVEKRDMMMKKVVQTKKPVSAVSHIIAPETGEIIIFENVLSPIIENGQCKNILYVSRDITEREKAKDALLESEKRMSSVFNSTKDQMAIVNIEKDGSLILEVVNNSFRTGWKKAKIPFELDDLIGKDLHYYSSKVLKMDRSKSEDRFKLLNQIIQLKKGHSIEEEYIDLNGRKYFMALSITPILDEDGVCIKVLFVIRDITFRKAANERFISKILEAEDRERKRIAKELHDSLGQNLTTATLNLNYLNKVIHQVDKDCETKFETGMKFLNIAIDESRNIAHNLMPQSIVDFGYVLTVESMLEGLQDATPTDFVFYNNLNDERLPSYQELSLFRITQEAINNIIKHAEASKVTIQLMKYEDIILLTIEDDGKGFDLEKTKNRSFGLNNMKTRISSLSGSIAIDSSPGNGTFITAEIPL